jgi:AcrR family transcriptional regulator
MCPARALCLGAGTLCSARYNDTTREKLLAAASWLFCHTGFQATGVDAIARRAGTAKTSLYKHFGSKDGLIEAVLEREGAAWRAWFFAEMGRITAEGEGRLLAMFDILERWFADPHFFGCPFINAAGEFDIHNTRLRKIIVAHKAHLNGWIAAQAEMAARTYARPIRVNAARPAVAARRVGTAQAQRSSRLTKLV